MPSRGAQSFLRSRCRSDEELLGDGESLLGSDEQNT